MKIGDMVSLAKETFQEWSDDKCLRLGASLAYYTLSSLIPLLLVVVSVASFFLNFTGQGQDLQAEMASRIGSAVNNDELGRQIAEGITARRESAAAASIFGTILGAVFLLLSASGVFGELDSSFNIIWDVPNAAEGQGIWGFIKTKFLSFTLVLGVAFLLLVAQVITVTLTTLADALPLGILWTILNFAVQILLISAVFALLYKFLPDTKVEWRDVRVGGLIAAILWTVGQQLLSLYFETQTESFSALGTIGAVLAFLVYVYYSSQILFIGGEFTQVYARRHGSRAPVPGTATQQAITKEATLMVTAAATAGEQRHQEEIAALKTRQYAAAATGGIVGLLGGALVGGVGIVLGLARGLGRLRGKR